ARARGGGPQCRLSPALGPRLRVNAACRVMTPRASVPPVTRPLPGLLLSELASELGSRTRAIQTLKWLYGLSSLPERIPSSIPNVARDVFRPFAERHGLLVPKLLSEHRSQDGTRKFVFDLAGSSVESVLIQESQRSTVCLSSQAGCTRRCAFCATQSLGFERMLRAEEMLAQYWACRMQAPPDRPAKNVVFMGMGEPMDNLEEVLRAVELLNQGPAPGLRLSSVTVSTSGVVPGMRRFLRECKASLALSLNATTDEQRERLMPHNRTWPIAALLEVLREDAAATCKTRDTLVEYVLLANVNDTDADADRLISLLRDLPVRINLIPYNAHAQSAFVAPSPERVRAFQRRLLDAGYRCFARRSHGPDIAAACGQLALVALDPKRSLKVPAVEPVSLRASALG
ncbi:MAG TPA: 23S rRNA (adenine(2503)-C(2))-methyltransferase RlmN, partial [Polyangiaceae bacterium]|nr:23S rRNA (adenine(2503)-C(2))-methyltransferase RlmN [Polyangiaceae bacterium]